MGSHLGGGIMSQEYFIITCAHESIWPKNVLLYYAPDEKGYSTTLEGAGRYSEEQARKIAKPRDSHLPPMEFMVACAQVEAHSASEIDRDNGSKVVRVVAFSKFRELTGSMPWKP
jgi:hypothetical protein